MLAEATTERYLALIRRRLSRYRGRPDYEDIEGEAVLAVLQALAGLPTGERDAADGLVWVVAHHGASRFLRSSRNEYRTHNGTGFTSPKRVSLDALEDHQREWLLPIEPDFAPALIERLATRALWQEFWALVPERERPAVFRYLEEGATATWEAEADRTAQTLRSRVQRTFNRYRRSVGLPQASDNTRHKAPLPPGTLSVSPADADLLGTWEWFRHEGAAEKVYRSQPGERGKGLVFLAWEILTRRDGKARGAAERCRLRNGDPDDFTRENLARLPVNEARRLWGVADRAAKPDEYRAKSREWDANHREWRAAKQRERRHAALAGHHNASGRAGLSPLPPAENARGSSP